MHWSEPTYQLLYHHTSKEFFQRVLREIQDVQTYSTLIRVGVKETEHSVYVYIIGPYALTELHYGKRTRRYQMSWMSREICEFAFESWNTSQHLHRETYQLIQ